MPSHEPTRLQPIVTSPSARTVTTRLLTIVYVANATACTNVSTTPNASPCPVPSNTSGTVSAIPRIVTPIASQVASGIRWPNSGAAAATNAGYTYTRTMYSEVSR